MRSDAPTDVRLTTLLVLSFLPFLAKAVDYLRLGGYTPAIAFALLAGLVAWGFARGGVARRRAIRTWALAMMLWALARFAILAMFSLTSVSEAAIEASFGIGFVLLSTVYLVAGFVLFRRAARVTAHTPTPAG